jgi:hypothetical protein
MSNADRWNGYGYAFFGLCFLVGFYALIDWCADGYVIEYALGIWNSWPELMRLVIVCLLVGLAAIFGTFAYLVRSAVEVDENDCPIEVKRK